MILKGIIEDTFGGRLIFRGFAPLKHLSLISKSEMYQREVDNSRLEEIIDFLTNNPFSFFPELIFGLQFEDSTVIEKIRDNNISLHTSQEGIKIKKGKFTFQTEMDKSSSAKIISIEFSEQNKVYLSRIDGNHRLSAVDFILSQQNNSPEINSIQQKIGNIIVPFSILLQIDSDLATKYETAFFYLINARSKPLTTEQNLNAIFTNIDFSDSDKIKLLGNNAILIESLTNEINSDEYPELKKTISINAYSFCSSFANLLDSTFSIDYLKPTLKQIDVDIYENRSLRNNYNSNILIALLYCKSTKESLYIHFKNWILNYHIDLIKEIHPLEILQIFEKTHKKRPYLVFVAMPYVSFKRVNEYNQLFKEVLKEIQEKEEVLLELIPIMRFRGASQRIDQRLIQKIKECDIFIADLTECNNNVIFEVGLAEGNGKPMILLKADDDKVKAPFQVHEEYVKSPRSIPFDMDKLQYIPYSSTGYYNDIKAIIKNNLPEILKAKYNEK